MNKPVFFIDTDTMNLLLHSELEHPTEEFDLVAEFTDIPYWATLRFLKTRIVVTVFRRLELHSPDEKYGERLGKATDHRNGKVDVSAVPEIGENIGPMYWTCLLLCSLMAGKQPADRPKDGGILVENKNGEWLETPVRGKQRPDLMVTTLFNGDVMARPYVEDVFERDLVENMDTEELKSRAEAGDIASINELAMRCLNGDEAWGREPDPEQAAYWFRRSAEEGDPYGMFNYALHLAKGHGVPRDFSAAAEWMKKAAEAGDPDAEKISLDYRMMAVNLEKAEAGDPDAQKAFAESLLRHAGDLKQAGAERDRREASRWYGEYDGIL